MKQRITYVVKDPDTFNPDLLQVKKDGARDSFVISRVQAAKEHRITLGLDELPSEVRLSTHAPTPKECLTHSEKVSAALGQWHELHIRWASSTPFTSTPPFTSRVSPGLHVFFTPLQSTLETALCEQLHAFVDAGAKCTSTSESSTKLPVLSERFSMSASSQYYTYLASVREIATVLGQRFCKSKGHQDCLALALSISTASYLDIDYDTTRALVINAGWPSPPDQRGWTETISQNDSAATVEIGVLNHENNPDPEDIQFGGFLTVLGQDSKPKPTRFQTPTRHYPLLSPATTSSSSSSKPLAHSLTYTTAFQHPTGLHPTLTLSFPAQHLAPPHPTCKLHTHLTLPSYLFIDKYQFTDPLFLASNHLARLRSLAGATDLEAPDWVVDAWGSAALFEMALPLPPRPSSSTQAQQNSHSHSHSRSVHNVSIPLHVRYMAAAANASHARRPLPWPVVFWACRADQGGPKMAANPFDRVHLGYEALFGPKTRFMHVEPAEDRGELVEWIHVPVLDLRGAGWVERVTVGTVLGAFLGLCWVLFGRGGQTVDAKEKRKKEQ
ncbi:protease B nonderepressible form [Pleosporales sp. CAS-2024a]